MNSFTVQAGSASFSQAVQSIINRTCICEFGIVKNVDISGILQVAVSVALDPTDTKVFNCIHIVPYSTSLMVDIKPKVDDKVIVFFPRRFNSDMFSLEQNEIIFDENGKGLTYFTGLAMLVNQFRPDDYKNFITVDEGKLTIKLAYSEDEDKNLISLETNEKGEVTLDINKVNLVINKDSEISLKDNDVSIEIDKHNAITIDTSKATVEIDKNGNITLNSMGGKLSIKNNSANLFNILNSMLTILNSSLATQGSPALHTVVPNQFTQQVMDLGNLLQ